MSGLREKSKARRRQAILRAAAELFAEHDYTATRMEMIAEQAEVALSTLYQYFPSKADLAREIYRQDTDLVRGRQEDIIAHPPDDPVEAVMALIETDVNSSLDYTDARTWRQIVVAGFMESGRDGMGVDPFSETEVEPFQRLLETLCKNGHLPSSTDVPEVAKLLGLVNMGVFFHNMATQPGREKSLERARPYVETIIGRVA
ncbi:MAG: TetR/AcrR family transcriptional regulator [Pseudomonadota bacterium]